MRTKRAFAALAALTLLCAGAAIAADNSAVVGKWTIPLDFQGNSFEVTLEITEGDDGLSGTWTTPRGSDTIADAAWDGETLTFQRNLERQGQSISIDCSATVAGNTMSGKMTTPRGDREFTGTRAE